MRGRPSERCPKNRPARRDTSQSPDPSDRLRSRAASCSNPPGTSRLPTPRRCPACRADPTRSSASGPPGVSDHRCSTCTRRSRQAPRNGPLENQHGPRTPIPLRWAGAPQLPHSCPVEVVTHQDSDRRRSGQRPACWRRRGPRSAGPDCACRRGTEGPAENLQIPLAACR